VRQGSDARSQNRGSSGESSAQCWRSRNFCQRRFNNAFYFYFLALPIVHIVSIIVVTMMERIFMTRVFERWDKQKILKSFGILFLLVGIFVSWQASKRQGQDFGVLYAAAIGVASGAPIYESEWQSIAFKSWGLGDVKNVPYPPSSGFLMLPFALFSFPVAQSLWFLLMAAAVIVGVRALIKLALPNAPSSVWLFSASAVMLSACIRWGMTPLQGAPLVFGLLALLVVSLHTNAPRVAMLTVAGVTAMKFTVAFPFLALLLLHKRYAALVQATVIVVVLNVLGFARIGGWSAFVKYRAGLQGHELYGTVDSPDPWDLQSVPRLDWAYMLNGLFGPFEPFRVIALLAFGLVCFWLLSRSAPLSGKAISLECTAIFLVPLVCVNQLAIYHHHYDISPLLAPLLIIAAKRNEARYFNDPVAWFLMAPLAVMMALLPLAISQTFAVKLLGASGHGLLNLAFPIATTLMLAGSLIFVARLTRKSATGATHQTAA
jgi:Glycosyltransferase family 87